MATSRTPGADKDRNSGKAADESPESTTTGATPGGRPDTEKLEPADEPVTGGDSERSTARAPTGSGRRAPEGQGEAEGDTPEPQSVEGAGERDFGARREPPAEWQAEGVAVGDTVGNADTETEREIDEDSPEETEDDTPEEPPHEAHEAAHEEPHEEPAARSFAATALGVLVGILLIASLTLWLAPKVAPYVPAPVAAYLLPGQAETEARFAALEEELAALRAEGIAGRSALEQRLATLAPEIEAARKAADDAANRIDEAQKAAETALAEARAAADRIEGLDGALRADLASLREELAAATASLSAAPSGAAPAELGAAVAALRSRVENLAARVADQSALAALGEQVGELARRLDTVETRLAELSRTRAEVSKAVLQARIEAGFDLLASQLRSGEAYGARLAELAELTGSEPPAALAAGASTGLPTAEELKATFPRFAKAAIAADIEATSGDNVADRAIGWLRAQLAGRPVEEQEGDTVEAITSRIAARLEEGDLAAALAEAESLPEHAQAALGDWLARLRARVGAEKALAGWRAEASARG